MRLETLALKGVGPFTEEARLDLRDLPSPRCVDRSRGMTGSTVNHQRHRFLGQPACRRCGAQRNRGGSTQAQRRRANGSTVLWLWLSERECEVIDRLRQLERDTNGKPESRPNVIRAALASLADEYQVDVPDGVFVPRRPGKEPSR